MAGKNSKPNTTGYNLLNRDMIDQFMQITQEKAEAFDQLSLLDSVSRHTDTAALDTHACEWFFLCTFANPEMLEDFPVIASDFLKHEFANLDRYDKEDCLTEDDHLDKPSSGYINWILNMMLNAAKQGNGYAIGLFQNLYQTYYKKEYKMLKRFRRITRDELLAVAEDGYDVDSMANVARLLIMCRLSGIELDKDCYIFFYVFQKMLDEHNQNVEEFRFEGFSKENVASSVEYVHAELEKGGPHVYSRKNKTLSALHDGERFITEAEKWLALPRGFVDGEDDELQDYEDWLIRALELMKAIDPDKEYSFEEIQNKAVLLHVMCALGCYHDCTTANLQRMFGINQPFYEWENQSCWFDPSKVRIPSGYQYDLNAVKRSDTDKKILKPVQDTGNNEDLLQEIESLRAGLRKRDQEIAHLKARNQKLTNTLDEREAAENIHAAEHEELLHLRDFVSRMTEAEQDPDDKIDLSEMEEVLRNKKVIIIGGHSNWVYKLRNKFRKWIFLKPEINNTIESTILDGADFIYFFTDTISHGTYGKYMKAIRSRGISSYDYIHSINIENNIRQIYGDLTAETEAE